VNSSLPNRTVASLSGLMEETGNVNDRQSGPSTDVGTCKWVNDRSGFDTTSDVIWTAGGGWRGQSGRHCRAD
jgi:hypothetical protein